MNETIWMMDRPTGKSFDKVDAFLKKQGIRLEENIEFTYAILVDDEVIATASLDGCVIKCVAVSCEHQGLGLMNKVISEVVNEAYRKDRMHLFVYTKPKNVKYFEDLGFYSISTVDKTVALLENKKEGIKKYLLRYKKTEKTASGIVMNCNPFTLGHRYLIEKAAEQSAYLYVFLVSENKSEFSTAERLNLVRLGISDLKNVQIVPTEHYLISSATFPTYFLKTVTEQTQAHMALDLQVFIDHFSKALNIQTRFVGEEPFCQLTGLYNQMMKEKLPKAGISVIELPRFAKDGVCISASMVRLLIKEKRFDDLLHFVPRTTYEYIKNKYKEGFL